MNALTSIYWQIFWFDYAIVFTLMLTNFSFTTVHGKRKSIPLTMEHGKTFANYACPHPKILKNYPTLQRAWPCQMRITAYDDWYYDVVLLKNVEVITFKTTTGFKILSLAAKCFNTINTTESCPGFLYFCFGCSKIALSAYLTYRLTTTWY